MNFEENIDQRIARLEKQNFRLKLVGFLAFIALTTVSALPYITTPEPESATSKVVEAESFIIRGPNGEKMGIFGMADGLPTLALNRSSEEPVILLSAEKETTLMVLSDAYGNNRVNIGVTKDSTFMAFTDNNGKLRTQMSWMDSTDKSGIIVNDKHGNKRVEISASEDSTVIGLADNEGCGRSTISWIDNGDKSGVIFYDKVGNVRADMLVDGSGSGIHIRDEEGNERTMLAHKDELSILKFVGKNSKEEFMLFNGPQLSALMFTPSDNRCKASLITSPSGAGFSIESENGLNQADIVVGGGVTGLTLQCGKIQFKDKDGKVTQELPK